MNGVPSSAVSAASSPNDVRMNEPLTNAPFVDEA